MNKNYFLSRLICFLILQAILLGQKQFGRIFIENENPLFKKNTKDITVKEKREISNEVSNTVEIEDSIAIEPKVLSPKPKEENLSKFDNVDSIKSKNKMVSKAIVKTEKKKIKKLKVVLSSDSVVTKRGLIYRTDMKEKFSGRIVDKWENGNNKVEIRIKDGLKHGSSKEWFSSGQKMKTSVWKNGDLHGYSREWYENAQAKSKGKYLFGRKHETWYEYFRNGQINKKLNYSDGVPSGLIEEWFSNGQQKEKGSVIKDILVIKTLAENNISVYNKIGLWKKWYLNGQKKEKGSYIDGQKNGIWIEWYENGEKKSKGNYVDNTKQDIWTYWYDDGNKKSKGSYQGGYLNGQWTHWYEWIWKNAAGYTARENNTSYTTWYIDGQIQITENWNKGKKDGVWTWWNKEGFIDSTGKYENNMKNGKWTEWDSTLQAQLEINWDYDKKIGKIIHPSKKRKKNSSIVTIEDGERTEWYADGKLKSKKKLC